MAGISSKALQFGGAENRYKYNGIEYNADLDLNMYDAFYRNLDPQTGRFWQSDPETEYLESYSPYESMGNNPTSNVDPLGDFRTRFGAWWHSLWHGGDVGENKFGEYYVIKSEDGGKEKGPTITITYGKGRDKYSNAKEALLRDFKIMDDIRQNGENSMYQMYDSPEEAGNAALSLGTGVVLISPILKSGTTVANAGKVATEAKANSLVKTGIEVSQHATQRMAERGITLKMVKTALAKGTKYFDPKNGTFNYVLKNGFASGKDLLVGTNTLTGKVTTVLRGNNLVKARFIAQ